MKLVTVFQTSMKTWKYEKLDLQLSSFIGLKVLIISKVYSCIRSPAVSVCMLCICVCIRSICLLDTCIGKVLDPHGAVIFQ